MLKTAALIKRKCVQALGILTITCAHSQVKLYHTPRKVPWKPSWEVEAIIMRSPFLGKHVEKDWPIFRPVMLAWLALTQLATSCIWQLHTYLDALFQRLHSCKFRFMGLRIQYMHATPLLHAVPPTVCYHPTLICRLPHAHCVKLYGT